MTNNTVQGVENETSQKYQSVASFGGGLLDDVVNAFEHPINTIENVGSDIYHGVENTIEHPINTVENVGDDIYNVLKKGVSYVVHTSDDIYDKITGTSPHTIYHAAVPQPSTSVKQPETKQPETKQPETKQPETKQSEMKQSEFTPSYASRARKMLKVFLHAIIILLTIALIGTIVYMTFVRYSLVGDAITTGNKTVAYALLTPELSAGLSTLVSAL